MQTQFITRYQTIVPATVNKVWEALTNPDLVNQYFFGAALVTDWEVGHPIIFKGEWEGTPYEDIGTVLEYIANQKLTFSYLSNWSGKEDLPDNYLTITYAVNAVDGGTELIITQTNYDEEKVAHSLENWTVVMDGMKALLEAQK
jgi:uncharacterized protein YndB with AHSA1/START domain